MSGAGERREIEVRVGSLDKVAAFATLPPLVQSRLLRVVRLLGGASQQEKQVAQRLIRRCVEDLRGEVDIQPTAELLDTLANLAEVMRHAAEPQEETA